MLQNIQEYQTRGWRVIQIHRVSDDGACSCWRGASCPAQSRGKHPVTESWTTEPVPPHLIALTWGPNGDAWNVGILTGMPSGFWVLDVDPEHDGPARLAELEAIYGALPATHTVRTGSGGWHYYFAMPADGSDVTNGKGRLPRGLDVRGTGGQVVAPPSVSGKGPYLELTVGVEVAAAPAWLYGLIRPDGSGRDRTPLTVPAGSMRIDPATLEPTEARRVHLYAVAAVEAECTRAAVAQVGERNNVAFAAACNLIEILNAPWSQLDGPAVAAAWRTAVERTGLDQVEIEAAWRSAAQRVAGRARTYPPLGGTGYDPPGGLPPFPAPPASWPATGETSGPIDSGRKPLRERGLTVAQLRALPPLEWLVKGWLVTDASSWLIGAPGVGKSFAAVSLACSVATGAPWFGHRVRPGRVLYVAAEGGRGIYSRVVAWQDEYWSGADIGEELIVMPEPIQASDMTDWAELCEWVADDRFALVVLDTQARVTVGMDENSNTEMGIFVEQVERVRRAAAGSVLVIHHEGHQAGRGRGASSLKGASQTEIIMSEEKATNRLRLTNSRQKDGPEAAPLHLMLARPRARTDVPDDVRTIGQPGQESDMPPPVVLKPWASNEAQIVVDMALSGAANSLAQIMASTFYEGFGGTRADIKGVATAAGMSRTTFYEAFNRLLATGVVGVVTGRGSFRWIPEDERDESAEWLDLGNGTRAREAPRT